MDVEINMTASIAQKMLQRHEELVSVLPQDIKALIPRLNDFAGLDMANTVGTLGTGGSFSGHRSRETTGSSTASQDLRSPHDSTSAVLNPMLAFASPDIPNDHFGMNDIPSSAAGAGASVGMQHRRARSAYIPPNSRDTYAEIQQQEAEERLAAMEQALTEARESEEAQRKAAARLRRDFEKLQRDYERAEAQAIKQNMRDSISSVGAVSVGSIATPTRRSKRSPRDHDSQSRRPTPTSLDKREVVSGSAGNDGGRVGLGWGMFTFPEFPTEPGPSNWQSPQKSSQSPYTAKPPRPMEGHYRRRRERMAEAGTGAGTGTHQEAVPMSTIKEGPISGLPPTTTTTPIRHSSSRQAFSPPSVHYPRSPIYQMDVTQYDSETSPQASPSRHLRSLAPSPASALGHLADKMSYMRDFITDSLSGPTRSLGSEIRGAELDQASEGPEGIKMDHIQGSKSLRCISSVEDLKVTERSERSSTHSSPHKTIVSSVADEDKEEEEEEEEDELDDEDSRAILAEMSRGRTPRPNAESELRQRHSYRLLTLPKSHGLEMPDPPSPLRLALAPHAVRSTSRPRPMSYPMLMLSHRRRVSSPGRELREQIEMRRKEEEMRTTTTATVHNKDTEAEVKEEEVEEDEVGYEESEEEKDTLSVPSRIINDAIILLGLLTEWLEVSLVIVYRVFVEARNGRRPNGRVCFLCLTPGDGRSADLLTAQRVFGWGGNDITCDML